MLEVLGRKGGRVSGRLGLSFLWWVRGKFSSGCSRVVFCVVGV